MFELTAADLERLCALNEFPVNQNTMVFMGIRGCLPINTNDHAFASRQKLTAANVDWVHPRCTLVQWLPQEGNFAVYPGSTVPHQKYIKKARQQGGAGANQLLTGFFDDYRKGTHHAGKSGAHEAFRQTETRIVRRTADDLDYDTADPISEGLQFDNLHAAWCGGIDDVSFASAGCQVVVGYPKCPGRGNQSNTGPWKAFHRAAYERGQDSFGYVLVNGSEVKRLVLTDGDGLERIRFGSRGPRAKRTQEALKEKGFYEGRTDGNFGVRSLRALLEFQTVTFGPMGDDGVRGPQTADAMDIVWP